MKPEPEYGEWTRGNGGQVGRTVTTWHETPLPGGPLPMVDWEPHPDETGTFGHEDDCACTSCALMAETRRRAA